MDDYEEADADLQLRGDVPDNQEWGNFVSWILLNAPEKSGTTKRRYLIYPFWIDAHEAYRLAYPGGVG